MNTGECQCRFEVSPNPGKPVTAGAARACENERYDDPEYFEEKYQRRSAR